MQVVEVLTNPHSGKSHLHQEENVHDTQFVIETSNRCFIVHIPHSRAVYRANNEPTSDTTGASGAAQPSHSSHFCEFPWGGGVTTQLYPLNNSSMPELSQAAPLYSQPDPPRCQTDAVYTAPTGVTFLLQYNCEDTLFARLFHQSGEINHDILLPQGYFMNWSPDGNWLLFRDVETGHVWLIPVAGGDWQLLPLPLGSYTAVFTPDGQNVLVAASAGLGLGSELGLLNLAEGKFIPWQSFPNQIVAHPAWSPDGSHLAYVLLPDTNIPFILGELWLADPAGGAPLTLLAAVDAGHGYPPRWSPDGNSLVYVHRENPDDIRANTDPLALRSNLYRVSINGDVVALITQFADSLVYDATWSADGILAFTVDDAVWTWTPGETPIQVSPPGIYRHPAWLSAAP